MRQGTFLEVLANKLYINQAISRIRKKKWERLSKANEFVDFTFRNDVKLKLYTDSVLSELIYFGNFEEEELTFFSNYIKKDWVIFDVGANIGLHSLYASKLVGPNGRVISFEPVRKTYERLEENIERNDVDNVDTYNIALSDETGVAAITTSLDGFDAWNSIAGNQKFIGDRFTEERIVTQTMDGFISEHCPDVRIDFIKIDTEGWELNVLKGGAQYLKDNSPVLMVEYAMNVLENFDRKLEDIFDLLTSYGYFLYRYNHKNDTFSKVERGVVMWRTNVIASKNIDHLKA